jgi:hypothetical protein
MGRIGRLAVWTGLVGALANPAAAETAAAHWDAYFYAAPRKSARVLDEIERETSLDVRGCSEGWCRVLYGETEGFVREDVVHGPANEIHPADTRTGSACFAAAQPGGAAWQQERFCPTTR